MDKDWAPDQFKTLASFSRISLIIQFHFCLEIFLRCILSKFQIKIPSEFYKIAHQLLEKVPVSDKNNKYLILISLTHIRNSYHSNGNHLNRTIKPVWINELKFEFINGQSINCADFKHVLVLIKNIISIMEEIVSSEKVKSIEGKILEHYLPIDDEE